MKNLKTKGIVINFLYNMIYQISLVILPLLTSPYLSRVIGPEGLGNYSYSYSIAYYFYMLGMLGINNFGNRSVAMVRDNQKKLNECFSKIYYFQLTTSLISTIIYIYYCLYYCETDRMLALVQVVYVITAAISIDWFYFGLEEFKVTVIRKTIIKIFTSICIFLFIKSPDELLLYALIISGAELSSELYLWFYLPKYVKFTRVNIKDIFSESTSIIILFIPIIATSIYRCMDKIILGSLSNMNDVGQFDYAEKIIMICLGCMTALGTVMLPKMSNLIASKKIDIMKVYIEHSMQFAMFMACGISFGLAAVANRFSIIYFGPEYVNCGIMIQYLSITVFPIAWANVLRTQYLIPYSRDKEFVISVLIGAVINFLLNIYLIPRIGFYGCIASTISAEFSVAILQSIAVRKDLAIKSFFLNTIPFFFAGLIMYNFIVFFDTYVCNDIIGLILQIIIGSIIYVTLLLVYCFFAKKEMYVLIKQSFRKGKLM